MNHNVLLHILSIAVVPSYVSTSQTSNFEYLSHFSALYLVWNIEDCNRSGIDSLMRDGKKECGSRQG